jgi:hypothetical protein
MRNSLKMVLCLLRSSAASCAAQKLQRRSGMILKPKMAKLNAGIERACSCVVLSLASTLVPQT